MNVIELFKQKTFYGKNNLNYHGQVKIVETGYDFNKHTYVPKTLPFLLKFIIR